MIKKFCVQCKISIPNYLFIYLVCYSLCLSYLSFCLFYLFIFYIISISIIYYLSVCLFCLNTISKSCKHTYLSFSVVLFSHQLHETQAADESRGSNPSEEVRQHPSAPLCHMINENVIRLCWSSDVSLSLCSIFRMFSTDRKRVETALESCNLPSGRVSICSANRSRIPLADRKTACFHRKSICGFYQICVLSDRGTPPDKWHLTRIKGNLLALSFYGKSKD